jgi:hypothetical protein
MTFPEEGTKVRGQVMQSNISRRVAGSWFIWFLIVCLFR